jgi:hypothetical protein
MDALSSCRNYLAVSPNRVGSSLVGWLLEGQFFVDCLLEGFRASVSNSLNFSQTNVLSVAILTNNFLTQHICNSINSFLLKKNKNIILY